MFCYTGVTARVVGLFSLSMYYSQNIVKEFFFFLMVVLHNLLSKRTKLSKGRQSEVILSQPSEYLENVLLFRI